MATASQSGQRIILEGKLQFPVIFQLRKKVESMLSLMSGVVEVDFQKVVSVDSSSLSFWLCCLRYAQGRGIQLQALNIPEDMQSIIKLVGLDDQIF
ncbi:MAG: hypothetical protein CSA60_03750 [Neptuniibacter caesariensis]|uniref:STAS domain-containing protein n=1 Tax=Neptuniibacter caesariensis TaxID=207954 RepID=A0A2G6JKS1_NEPCE|nr:MAG: hypothetical protein CSA60_03750 [Neptuniibacter caesariensis]